MRSQLILELFYKSKNPISIEELSMRFSVTDRTIRNEIKYLNETGLLNGFKIVIKRGQGYILVVEDYDLFIQFFSKKLPKIDIDNIEQRITYMQLLLFQESDYVTIEFIANQMKISQSTVKKDLLLVEKQLKQHQLSLEKKPHYGIKVIGAEAKHRKALANILASEEMYLTKTSEYNEFIQRISDKKLYEVISQKITVLPFDMNIFTFKNIVDHIKILAFRVSRENFVKRFSYNEAVRREIENSIFYPLSKDILAYLAAEYRITIPKVEEYYLTEQFIGKAYVDKMSRKEKQVIKKTIENVLLQLEEMFLLEFTQDEELVEVLINHLLPLLTRIYNNTQLDNPLIEDIYSRYVDAFNIAINFVTLLNDNYDFEISKDEIGYIAIYFAGFLERQKKQQLAKYKKILIVDNNNSSAFLIKTKLELYFSDAKIDTFVLVGVADYLKANYQSYDLILFTFDFTFADIDNKIKKISRLLKEQEILAIQKMLAERYSIDNSAQQLLNLLKKDLFTIIAAPCQNYLSVLEEKCNEMIIKKYAYPFFTKSVLEREAKISTIYRNGIAGPHAMEMGAKKEAISVIIFNPACTHEKQKVAIVFLINLKKGHLNIHKTISRLMIKIMNDKKLKDKLLKTNTYEEFYENVEQLVKKGEI
jgi:Transcriptional antiterminator